MLIVALREPERLLFTGPTRLKKYSTASLIDRWTHASMDANTIVGLVRRVPDFGARLFSVCTKYELLLPPWTPTSVAVDEDDVLSIDPHETIKKCLLQWKTFAEICLAMTKFLWLGGPCMPVHFSIDGSFSRACVCTIEEYSQWLVLLENSIGKELQNRKRPHSARGEDASRKEQRIEQPTNNDVNSIL